MATKTRAHLLSAGVRVSYKPTASKISIDNEGEAANCFNMIIDGEDYFQQNIYALFTDSEGMFICWRHINRGSATLCVLDLKTIIAIATQVNACGVYIGHTMPFASGINNSPILNQNMRFVRHAFAVCGITLLDYLLLSFNASGSFLHKSHLTPEYENYCPAPGMQLNDIAELHKCGCLVG